MEWRVQERSNIRKLPKMLWPAAVLARNFKEALKTPPFEADGVRSLHNTRFRDKPRFTRAYARAVKAGGWDFGIPFRVHQALWCSTIAQRVEGDFVELGTGRGFIMSALLEDGLKRPVHLFDTFNSGRLDEDGKQGEDASPYYATSFESVSENFSEWPNIHLHRGNIFDTLPKANLSAVAFLHIDMNHPDPEEFGLRQLWPLIPTGGVVLLDDYAYQGFERQLERMDRLAGELGFEILTMASGQGIVIK